MDGPNHTANNQTDTILMQAMHAGVQRDEEKQRIKRERMADFEMQRQLEEEYRKIQHVSDGKDSQSSSMTSPSGGSG